MDNDAEKKLQVLLHKVAAGDGRAFRELYDATSPRLFAIALKMLGATSAADDVLQDAYVQVWHRAGDYHVERGTVGTWLATIVRYRAIDQLRRNRSETPFDDTFDKSFSRPPDSFGSGNGDDASGPLGSAIAIDDNQFLAQCLERLSSTQRQSVALAFFRGLTHAELADATAQPLGTIKSRLRRSLQRLRECLDAIGFSDEISPGAG